jgi:hypothetical protein
MRGRAAAAWLIAGALVTIAVTGAAQPAPKASSTATPAPTGSDGDRAVALGRKGIAAFQEGKWLEAYARFSEANALSPSPVFVLYMGRSLRNAGRLIEARAKLRAMVDKPIAAGAPSSWHQAQTDARAEVQQLDGNIPTVVVLVNGAGASAPSLTLDDAPAPVGRPMPVDPGDHRLLARAGSREVAKTIQVKEAARLEVTLDLQAEGSGASSSVERPSTATGAAASADRRGSALPGIVALAVGGAALGVGAVTGVLALSRAGDAKDRCPDDQCPYVDKSSIESDRSAAKDIATVSTVAFLVGGVAAATGVVLLVVRPGGGAQLAPRGQARATSAKVTSVQLTPGGAVVRGAF